MEWLMKVLKVVASGLPLFSSDLEFDFLALQRVSSDAKESLYNLFSTYYQNNVLSIIGINASGKTTLLKVLMFALRLLNNEPINSIDCLEVFDGLSDCNRVMFTIYFHAPTDAVYKLHTVIRKKEGRLSIVEETLCRKPAASIKAKKALFDFSAGYPELVRDTQEKFLLDDVSIMVAFNKQLAEKMVVIDMLQCTNSNLLGLSSDIPPALIAFFDPSIEYLSRDGQQKESSIHLKFKGKEEILLNQPSELNRYLSSGTIKGINTFMQALKSFRTGGYVLIDEMENHFNKEIVSTLIRFYMDQQINPKGAVLVFSTHYAELLDEFNANDNIYIVRNKSGITVENLSKILKRNDIKKSDAYQSGFLEGTVPLYESYKQLRQACSN